MKISYWILMPSVILLFIILSFLGVFLFFEIKTNSSLSGESQKKILFEVKEGRGVKGIGEVLEGNEVIGSSLYFQYAAWRKGKSDVLQAGLYELSPSMSYAEIVNKIARGDIVDTSELVTIPEGFTLRQTEARLVAEGIVKFGELINFVNPLDFESIPADAGLVGFFFPDTYRLNPGMEVEEVVNRAIGNFQSKITDQMLSDIRTAGRNIYDVIKVASMIESEVKENEDMKLVSGIIWKRLAIDMPLQIDYTIIYGKEVLAGRPLSKSERRLRRSELSLQTPYNTYLYKGLPPTPISNPGLRAIKAAIYPQESRAFYYLSKPNGETVFSETLEEHNRARAKFLR